MAYIFIADSAYAAIIKHTNKKPAVFVRELVKAEIEKKGWDRQ